MKNQSVNQSTQKLVVLSFIFSLCWQISFAQTKKVELAKEKQTKIGLYVTAKEAYEKWKADSSNIKILDVRTTDEYIYIGHAAMAYNIPVFFQTYNWDSVKHHFSMQANPDFLSEVKSICKPNDILFITCRSGGRSALAVNMLTEAGFKQVYNITDGMEGDVLHNAENLYDGKRLVNGWKNSGNPWTYEIHPSLILLKK